MIDEARASRRAWLQENLDTIGLVNVDGWDGTGDLDLHALAVDKLAGSNDVIEDNTNTLAAINRNAVDLPKH